MYVKKEDCCVGVGAVGQGRLKAESDKSQKEGRKEGRTCDRLLERHINEI